MPLEFSFDVTPDEHGVYDGRELARRFLAAAFQVLTPYVSGCPACTDTLFSTLANDVLAELHELGRQTGQLPSATYALGPQEDRDMRQQQHLEAASAAVARMLREAGQQHSHDQGDDTPG